MIISMNEYKVKFYQDDKENLPVLNYIEELFKREGEVFVNENSESLLEDEEVSLLGIGGEITEEKQLNRKLLDECLAKSENEWEKLQNHYDDVLNDCVILDLGLNGGKLFNIGECEDKIKPNKIEDKARIQETKKECFASYSERQ